MTKKELIKALEPFDDNMEVVVNSVNGEYNYGTIEGVRVVNVRFSDDGEEDGDFTAYDDCILIEEQ